MYEYLLGNFALKDGQKGGVFFTPTSIVRLIVEFLQPFHGRVGDLACGPGGMFVQSAAFVMANSAIASLRPLPGSFLTAITGWAPGSNRVGQDSALTVSAPSANHQLTEHVSATLI